MRLGIVIDREKQDAANKFFDELNPENGGNSLPNVELVDSGGNVVADYCDLVPRDIERLKAMEKFGGLEGRRLFDQIEDHFNGKARIYEIKKDPSGTKEVKSMQEILDIERLSKKESETL